MTDPNALPKEAKKLADKEAHKKWLSKLKTGSRIIYGDIDNGFYASEVEEVKGGKVFFNANEQGSPVNVFASQKTGIVKFAFAQKGDDKVTIIKPNKKYEDMVVVTKLVNELAQLPMKQLLRFLKIHDLQILKSKLDAAIKDEKRIFEAEMKKQGKVHILKKDKKHDPKAKGFVPV